MKIFNACLKMFLLLIFFLVSVSCALSEPMSKSECSEWSGIICKELGGTAIGCGKMGVNLSAWGLIEDQAPLKLFGFQFDSGHYRMTATRIDTGRYSVTVQSMSRRGDHQEKEVLLKTNADIVYPVNIASASAGKYMWNSAIQYDMEHQLGMRPIYEIEEKSVDFVDIIISDPAKMADAGFPGFKKNDSNCQLLYKENNRWELSPAGGMLVYENSTWVKATAASESKSPPVAVSAEMPTPMTEMPSPLESDTPTLKPQAIFFEAVDAYDISYNNSPEKLKVYVSSQSGEPLYLVYNDRIGTGLIDPEQGRVYDANSAAPSTDGQGMQLKLDETTAISPSGVTLLKGKSKNRIEAWWNHHRLAFSVWSSVQEDQPSAFSVQNVSNSQATESEPPASGVLFVNSDFENGDLTNWTSVGNAFEYQPTKGDNPTARGRRNQPSNHQGEFWIGTFEKYQGKSDTRPGQCQGDQPVGTITSVPFQIAGDRIGFLIGGGKRLDTEYVALLVEGEEVFRATGKHNEKMQRVIWDVTAYKGKEAQIVINDKFVGGWGHINADDFCYEQE